MSDDLVKFLKARFDEDEAAAKAGARRLGMPWHAEPQPGTPGGLVIDELGLVASTGGKYAADHIARHDPARALREVEAKRAILARYGEYPGTNIGEQLQWSQEQQGLYRAMCALAAVWSDHPDYRDGWKP